MVAQLKNQDPMNPASSTEFLAQTAQFTSVEKLTQLVQQYTDLITAQKVTEATGLLGHIVGFTDANGNPTQGIVDSVRLSSGGPVLRVGNADVPLASISTITG
jgi:flagellar basal-body rod modification protein FlgD